MNEYYEELAKLMNQAYDMDEVPVAALIVKDGNIIFEKSGRLRQATKDSFMRDMDTLLRADSGVEFLDLMIHNAQVRAGTAGRPQQDLDRFIRLRRHSHQAEDHCQRKT